MSEHLRGVDAASDGERRVSVETASQLLDFTGGGTGPITPHAAREQLRGSVALHNILQEQGIAYLADEVGMGKTYVALGALALFRHFDPHFRVLVIAPRENIQKKWRKELRNFAARNVVFPDLRVKAVHGLPARATVLCDSLLELVRETAVDPDRDFFTRLTSFSFPLGKDSEGWKTKRDQIREHLPWLDESLFDLRNKDRFKDNFARAVNCAIPAFDLVIFDEGHNIKGGWRGDSSSRNRMLALAFGHPREGEARQDGFAGYGKRAKRVLFLSATPLENDYVQLWNQLDIFGFGSDAAILRDPNASDEEKRDRARGFLIRRVTTLPVAGEELTKNLYRREWRGGGVARHDDPLSVPDERQRLAVALVQKKVSEVLQNAKFNNCFQIGMLASFESFLETARVRSKGDDSEAVSTFDDPDQTDDELEKQGVDVGSVNHLARSYRRRFKAELPHPKMDAVVDQLSAAYHSGEKALVFVRRVASVKELQRKLEERYDDHLFRRLRSELKPELLPELERVIDQYRQERALELERRTRPSLADSVLGDESIVEEKVFEDEGGLETFFAWFFRGDGPKGRVLSGAKLQRRFSQAGSIHSSFFEDNHVAWLLGVRPGEVTRALGEYLGRPAKALAAELGELARIRLPRKQQRRRDLFLAFQEAAVWLLAQHPGPLRERALIVREERFSTGDLAKGASEAPILGRWLEVSTFWTALRERPALREALWPEPRSSDRRSAFRERELRRELFSAMARLGHPFIDLYTLSVNRLERLALRAREQDDEEGDDLAAQFLDLLESQAAQGATGNSSYRELAEAARNFDLILAVNDPAIRDESLAGAATLFGRLLRAQQPVGGMFGKVNETLVRQFRMPGYPLVLITTDLLQEGEDLHTFCSTVHHYGISWMPSSMEQRVGRVDRVGSRTDRRLSALDRRPTGDELLQVYYPHLRETVEVLQVERVLERLNRFMRLMHENIGGEDHEERSLNVSTEILRSARDLEQLKKPLRTAFPIREETLRAPSRRLEVPPDLAASLVERFLELTKRRIGDHEIVWDDPTAENALRGTIRLHTRQQPFTLLLRSVSGRAAVRCVSPIGRFGPDLTEERVRGATRLSGVRVGAVYDEEFASYDLTIEGDVLLGAPEADFARVGWLLDRVTKVADELELELLGLDQPMSIFREDLDREASYER